MSGFLARFDRGDTITERYKSIGGFTSGFDYLRIILAVGVVLQHSVLVISKPDADAMWMSPLRATIGWILPAFFALSGFLVAASLKNRPSLASFISLRAIRLLPALAVEVLLSALLIGALLTEHSWSTYFTAPDFWAYFLNIVGDVHFSLPGVFTHNQFANVVNQSIWTLPFELNCYLALMGLYLVGAIRQRKWLLWIIALLTAAGTAWLYLRYKPIWETAPVAGRALVVAFLLGVAAQLYAERIRLNLALFTLSAIVGSALLLDPRLGFFAVLPITYATIYLGMLNPKRLPVILSGDYSYGLYLFAFPIQQLHYQLFPAYRTWYYNSAFTLVFGFAYAAFSWWCVERPVLRHKKAVAGAAEWVGRTYLSRAAIERGLRNIGVLPSIAVTVPTPPEPEATVPAQGGNERGLAT